MYARVLSLHVRLERRQQMIRKTLAEIAPILKRSPGALQVLVMQHEAELDNVLILSIWKTREDIERYHANHFERMKAVLKPYITFPPTVTVYRIDESLPSVVPFVRTAADLRRQADRENDGAA